MSSESFTPFELRHGIVVRDEASRSMMSAWRGESLALIDEGTHFGFVYKGHATLQCLSGIFTLGAGMYFSVPGAATICGCGSGTVVTQYGYTGVFLLGGPIEPQGRLRYIDGCTDSLLLGPVLRGDPCLNLLHIPPHVNQTAHTHPSLRIGLVVRGGGECRTSQAAHTLTPGLPFVIWPDRLHSFHTQDLPLTVIAYHPDSDFGPTSEDHPMINRTVIRPKSQ